MKSIKFRYSVKRKNGHTFCSYFTIRQIEKGDVERFLEINHVAPEELHKEQFSGLYDINKIEIYFLSDIVQATTSDDFTGKLSRFSGVLYLCLKTYRIVMSGHEEFNLLFADELEIIGNANGKD